MSRNYMDSKEVSGYIRKRLKEVMPEVKFSVTKSDFSGGRSVSIAVMEAPFEMTKSGFERHNVNHYYVGRDPELTEKGKKVMEMTNEVVKEIHWDDSDPMTDYFSCNFYYSIGVGKWNKPFKVKPL